MATNTSCMHLERIVTCHYSLPRHYSLVVAGLCDLHDVELGGAHQQLSAAPVQAARGGAAGPLQVGREDKG